MAESDPSTQSGSDVDLTDGLDGSPKKVNGASKSHKRLGSVRALAIKKVLMSPAHSFAGTLT